MSEEPKSLLRKWRERQKLSLEDVCDRLAEQGIKRPSAAKLSRIECERQSIPLDMVPALEAITAIPAKDLLPMIAKIFEGEVTQ